MITRASLTKQCSVLDVTALNLLDHIWDKIFKNEPSKIFKGCLLKILLGPFLNTLPHFSRHLLQILKDLLHYFFIFLTFSLLFDVTILANVFVWQMLIQSAKFVLDDSSSRCEKHSTSSIKNNVLLIVFKQMIIVIFY